MRSTNLDVRVIVAESNVSYKQIAAQMGVSAVYLSRVMGKPLKTTLRARILAALAELTGQEVGGDGEAE